MLLLVRIWNCLNEGVNLNWTWIVIWTFLARFRQCFFFKKRQYFLWGLPVINIHPVTPKPWDCGLYIHISVGQNNGHEGDPFWLCNCCNVSRAHGLWAICFCIPDLQTVCGSSRILQLWSLFFFFPELTRAGRAKEKAKSSQQAWAMFNFTNWAVKPWTFPDSWVFWVLGKLALCWPDHSGRRRNIWRDASWVYSSSGEPVSGEVMHSLLFQLPHLPCLLIFITGALQALEVLLLIRPTFWTRPKKIIAFSLRPWV